MSTPPASLMARLFAGAELDQYRQQTEALERAQAEADAARRQTEAALAETRAQVAALETELQARSGVQDALAETQQRLKAVEAELKVRTDIMNVTSIVSESDKKGDILSVNDKFIEVSKYPLDELIGHPHNTTRHPDMPKETFKALWQTIGRGDIFRGVIKNRAKDGTPYYVDAVIAPILGDNGKPMKYLGVRYDITEAELERQNARGILAAIDGSSAFVEMDLQGHVLKANALFLQSMGYRSEEVVGRHHKIFVDPVEAASAAYERHWAELRSGRSLKDVVRRITKTGQDVFLQAIYAPCPTRWDAW
jgi:methyl-accepting chemotaxis protein